MKLARQLVLGVAALGVGVFSIVGAAAAVPLPLAPNPDPVAQALIAASAKMVPPTKINQTIPLKSKPPSGRLLIFMNPGNAPAQLMAAGMRDAASALGWSFESVTYNPASPATLQAGMMTALQKQPVGVLTIAEDPSKWGAAVTAAYANARVPIVAGSQCPLTAGGPVFPGANGCASFVGPGKALADWFIADSKGKGSVIWQSMSIYTTYVVLRDSFLAEIKAKCPGCTAQVVETTLGQLSAGQIPSLMVNALRANPNVNYLFFDNAAWSNGIMSALDAAGLLGRIKVGGNAIDVTALSNLKNGQGVVWTASAYPIIGYAAVDSLLRVITRSSGVTKNAVVPFQLVTSVNAGNVTLPYVEPANALAQYKRLWRIT